PVALYLRGAKPKSGYRVGNPWHQPADYLVDEPGGFRLHSRCECDHPADLFGGAGWNLVCSMVVQSRPGPGRRGFLRHYHPRVSIIRHSYTSFMNHRSTQEHLMTITHRRGTRRLLTTSAILIGLTTITSCAGHAPAETADTAGTGSGQAGMAAAEGETLDHDEVRGKAPAE